MEKISDEKLCDEWLSHLKKTIKYNSYQKYEGLFYNYLKELIEEHSMSFLNEKIISNYLNNLINEKNISYQSAKTMKIVLKSLFMYGEENYNMNHIDFNNIIIQKSSKSQPKTIILNKQQESTIYSYCINNINSSTLAIMLALYTGLRLGEICAIKYDDIDFSLHTIKITRSVQNIDKNSGKYEDEIELTNWVSRRTVIIPDFLFEYLQVYTAIYKKDNTHNLLTNSNNFFKPRTLQVKSKELFHKLNIHCSFNILRNTFQNNCIESGMNIYVLLSLMGISGMTFELKENMNISIESKKLEMKKIKEL